MKKERHKTKNRYKRKKREIVTPKEEKSLAYINRVSGTRQDSLKGSLEEGNKKIDRRRESNPHDGK